MFCSQQVGEVPTLSWLSLARFTGSIRPELLLLRVSQSKVHMCDTRYLPGSVKWGLAAGLMHCENMAMVRPLLLKKYYAGKRPRTCVSCEQHMNNVNF